MALFSKSQARNIVTLAIESTDLRFLTATDDGVEKWGSTPLPPGLVSDGLITNPDQIGTIVSDLFAKEALDRRHVVTCLSGLRSIHRWLILPKVPPSSLGEVVEREAKREMPVPLEDLHLRWQSVPRNGEERVLLWGAPRELVDAQMQSLKSTGLPHFVIDSKPLALLRAVKRVNTAGQTEAIIANLEQDSLDLVLVVANLPAVIRSFSLAKERLDQKGRLDRLRNELTQTVLFYNDSHPNARMRPSAPVYVTGKLLNGSQTLGYLKAALDRPLQEPLKPLPCPQGVPLAEYTTNLGLALHSKVQS